MLSTSEMETTTVNTMHYDCTTLQLKGVIILFLPLPSKNRSIHFLRAFLKGHCLGVLILLCSMMIILPLLTATDKKKNFVFKTIIANLSTQTVITLKYINISGK